jgi:parallel beta-helix repeat protein
MNAMKRTIAAAATIAILSGAAFVTAGPLTPPAGPVAPTMKTLSDVEPRIPLNASTAMGDATTAYKITTPGSYYLTSDVWIPQGMSGITITAARVTIDLNGFTITGLNFSHEGITASAGGGYLTLKNGRVTNFGLTGVNLGGCSYVEVRDITTSVCQSGVSVGADSQMINCHADHSVLTGLIAGDRTTVIGCTASFNQNGFSGTTKDTFQSCTASENAAIGFNVGSQGAIRDCQALHNTLQGIEVADSCTVIGNQCRANGASGQASIWATGSDNTIQNNQTSASGFGVYVEGNRNTITGNIFNSPSQRAVYVGASGVNNLIIQNTAYNTIGGFFVPAFNRIGAILTPMPNAQAVIGTSGGGISVGDPYANLIIN